MKERVYIKCPSDILPLVHYWGRRREENFLTVTLDSVHRVIKVHHITKGLLNRTIIHPRECFFPAVRDYAAAVMFVHNHPSGKVGPSGNDDDITMGLYKAADILGFNFLDHMIVNRAGEYFSYRQEGRLSAMKLGGEGYVVAEGAR